MGKYKHNEFKDLAEYVKAHKKKDYDLTESIRQKGH